MVDQQKFEDKEVEIAGPALRAKAGFAKTHARRSVLTFIDDELEDEAIQAAELDETEEPVAEEEMDEPEEPTGVRP